MHTRDRIATVLIMVKASRRTIVVHGPWPGNSRRAAAIPARNKYEIGTAGPELGFSAYLSHHALLIDCAAPHPQFTDVKHC
jgi:hypothetical protein